MTVRTRVDEALERVDDERRRLREKRSGLEEFERELREVPARSVGSGRPDRGVPTAVSVAEVDDVAAADRCRRLREAFAGTVRPPLAVDESEPLSTTIEAKLGAEVATALAPETVAAFSERTKAALLSAVADRRAELASMDRALKTEGRSLRATSEAVEGITAWIADADEIPLSELGFADLRARHEALSAHRGRCEEVVSDRQAALDGRSFEGPVALSHRALVEVLYAECPVDHPVLATCVRLIGVCADSQRAVRAHLVRRV